MKNKIKILSKKKLILKEEDTLDFTKTKKTKKNKNTGRGGDIITGMTLTPGLILPLLYF